MHAKVMEKIGVWVGEIFTRIGEFCEVTVETDTTHYTHRRAQWPTAQIEAGSHLGAVQGVRGDDTSPTFGVVLDRGLAIYLTCRLMMLLPSAIEDKLKSPPGPLEEDVADGLQEVGNLITGVLSQLISAENDAGPNIALLGIHGPGVEPSRKAFDQEMEAFDLAIKVDRRAFKASLYLPESLINLWFERLIPKSAPAEVTSDADSAAGASTPRPAAVALPTLGEGGRSPWLIVDRLESDRERLRDILAGVGIPALEAATVFDAIQQMKAYLVEGIFLDGALDEQDGLGFLKRLRANFLTDDLPIIVTGHQMTRDQVMDAVRSGATHILVKPLQAPTVGKALEKAAARHPRLRDPRPAAA